MATKQNQPGRIPTVEITWPDGRTQLVRKHIGAAPRHAASWAMQVLPYGTDFRGATFRKLYT